MSRMVPKCLIWKCIFQCLLRCFILVKLFVGPWDLLLHWMIRMQLNCEAISVAELLVLWLHVRHKACQLSWYSKCVCLYGVDAWFYPSIPSMGHRIQVLALVEDAKLG